MSSRQEEKEQRKQERLERERAQQQAAKRKRMLRITGGVVVGAAIVVGVALAVFGGKDSRDPAKLKKAAKTANCVVRSFPDYGRGHVTKKLTAANFKTNPPTSGNHNPNPAPDGVYEPGLEPEVENWVHTLEHGRILFQYKPGTSPAQIAQLLTLYNQPVLDSGKGYHTVLMQNNTNMPFAVAGVAWRHYVGCKTFTPQAIQALADFRSLYVDTAPEKIP